MTFEEKLKKIKRGVEEIVPEADLIKKLKESEKEQKPLRIKYGIDPTGSDVHIGHLVPIRKMRDFQDLGHIGVIIIGDFTAQIGDPTGRDESRPPLTSEQVKKNAERYMEQLYTVLDENRTEVRWQSEWFGDMNLSSVLRILSKFTLAQFLAHDTFRNRYEKGLPLAMHELMYPVLQAYDSVAIEADIELGATEQKFNILAGRDMLAYYKMEPQVAILAPILMGTDGINKMSKSLGNYIAVFDEPKEKYGKVMSIPDKLITNYFRYATNTPEATITEIEKQLKDNEINPKLLKQQLARKIVKIYHGEEVSKKAEEDFNKVFSQRNIPDDMPEFTVKEPTWIVKILKESGLCKSNGEARRLIKQNAVSIDGKKLKTANLDLEVNSAKIIKVGKRRFLKVIPE